MDTDSFIIYIKTEVIYVDTSKDIESRFDTSNYEPESRKLKNMNLVETIFQILTL